MLKTPKLYFVDLAGSERQRETLALGSRLKEASNINRSLTTLGMVINALSSGKSKAHIPFRDSKLTNLLRDSLGGNSKTFIIATVSNNVNCMSETLSTLNFASRAKVIAVHAQVNQKELSLNFESFQHEIKKLKSELSQLQRQKKTHKTSSMVSRKNCRIDTINDRIIEITSTLHRSANTPAFEDLLKHFERVK